MSHVRLELPEVVVPGQRLGRHVNHDPRSLLYAAPESANPASVSWEGRIPILDQGNLGSCTGNATTGELGTEPFYDTLAAAAGTEAPTPHPRSHARKVAAPVGALPTLDEAFAVHVYSLATQLDPFPGVYPPDDTGSDGLSAAKAVKTMGLASGYVHATTVGAMHTLIQAGPFALGLSWKTGCDNPDSSGVVHWSGAVRGGHEVCVVGYDSASNLWKVRNSWGGSWGKGGFFFLSDDDMVKILAAQGDATQIVPMTSPAPTPTPTPPKPGNTTLILTTEEVTALDLFSSWPHHYHAATVAAQAWTAARGAQ